MRVQLPSIVARLEVEKRLVEERDDLEVRGRTQELNTLDRTGGDETRAASGLRAPSDFFALSVGDGGWTGWGRPDTPICISNEYK